MGAMDYSLQIRMNISAEAIGRLPDRSYPHGYHLRKLRPGDEVHLPELMVSAGVGWTPFDATGMTEYLDAPDRWVGSRVVETDGQLTALCFATRREEVDPSWGQLDYVCVRPGHRGAGLGLRVCAAVLQSQRRRGYLNSTLTTLRVTAENLQLAAIKTYLSLGFLPVMTERNQRVCETVYRALGWPLPVNWWLAESPFLPIDAPDEARG